MKRSLICLCNEVDREQIENAIRAGAQSIDEIFDSTLAGVGPCGGSCRPQIRRMLETFRETGRFPTDLQPTVRPTERTKKRN